MLVLRKTFAVILMLGALNAASTCSQSPQKHDGLVISVSAVDPKSLIVRGYDRDMIAHFKGLMSGGTARFTVFVADAPPGSPALSGDLTMRGDDLVFTPRYPFQPGLKYRVDLIVPAAHPGSSATSISSEFQLPVAALTPVVVVSAIYPSSDVLPENLLKFYIQFSGPMSRGEAYHHIRLLDDAGKPVPYPFLELGEELWNPEMTRFTLFFDPGRIKQGLVPRLEEGPALLLGKNYTLVVDSDWQDAQHRPLVEPARKKFRAGPVDSLQPNPSRWRISPPPAGSTQDLIIVFDEPLDRGMLEHVLSIHDAAGHTVPGKVTISEHEQKWSLTPITPWSPGRHVLRVETILEDNAGNSIGRPFEVDLNRSLAPAGPETIEIPFEIPVRN